MTTRAERQKLYRSKRWAQLRRSILDRDGWRCVRCGRAGRLEVDHAIPMAAGGDPWSESNLQALCRGCHFRKTARENRKEPSPEVAAWSELVRELSEKTPLKKRSVRG